MATADLPHARRVDRIRALLDQLRQPHDTWLERWVVFSQWVSRSPEYVSWLLERLDEQAQVIEQLQAELRRRDVPPPRRPPPLPARLPGPPLPPPIPAPRPIEDQETVDLSDIIAEAFTVDIEEEDH